MTDYVFDKIGNLISVGDLIVYARSQGDSLHFGTVASIPNDNYIKVRNNDTSRISVNARRGNEVLVIEFLKDTNPEFFI